MSDWTIFAKRLSEQIKKQNLSIRQLAERMGMAPTTIFRYAKGQRVPRASEILKASDALGVTCDYLLGLSDDPKKTSRSSAQPEKRTEKRTETHGVCLDTISRRKAFEYFVTLWECIGTIMDRDEWEDVCMTTANEIPSAQPERKTGHWVNVRDNNIADCSRCNARGRAWMNFCPICGADMRGEKDEND